jgi:sugar phosphate isomerase/epimerase
MEIPGMRVDPGAAGPLPYDADYNEVWDRVVRTFQHHAEKGADVGCVMLWELESLQPFNKPSETVKMLEDVGHPNFKLMYDTGHFQACGVIGHNHVQPAETLPNQIEFIKMLPEDSIGHIHLCDTDMNTHLNMFGTKCNFGEGIIDFEELMPVLAEAYDGEWWAVDSIPMGSKAWQDTWDGLPFLNDLLDRHVRQPAAVAR